MTDPTWTSLLPPILAIALAIGTRQVIPSLLAGIWLGFSVLNDYNPLAGFAAALDGILHVFSEPGDARVIIFTLLIGSLIATIERSGGIRGFVHFLETRHWEMNGVRAQMLAWVTGIIIFVESNITLLVAGSVSRPLFDRYKISREKLAYIIDATSAPVCVMIPLNAWGAVIIGLVASSGVENPLEVFIASIPYNFYSITAILLAAVVILKNINIGPMRAAEKRTQDGEVLWPGAMPMVESIKAADEDGDVPSAAYMIVPIVVMILTMPIGLYVTGNGVIIEGSGSTAILWAICAAIAASWVMLLAGTKIVFADLMKVFVSGAGALLPIAIILLLALALGDVAKLLGTGQYVANFVGDTVPGPFLAPLVFITSAFIAFSVGSSWGTFAIMIPIAVPIALTLGLPVPLLLGAAISGAIFGDHASPISDTTVVASMASATDHIDHVRTQIPYALVAAAIATVLFLLAYFI
jgi:tetracycline resistance efflux pump